jgi:arginyl-tRNA synthetase
MKEQIALLLNGAIEALKADGKLPADLEPNIQVENTRDKAHGDLATNLAMTLAKPARYCRDDFASASRINRRR